MFSIPILKLWISEEAKNKPTSFLKKKKTNSLYFYKAIAIDQITFLRKQKTKLILFLNNIPNNGNSALHKFCIL